MAVETMHIEMYKSGAPLRYFYSQTAQFLQIEM